ncbi:hypothetical protein CAC01_16375 [Streptomyces sp. CLI2509]|nr:hypothetical protein CAC01_16375 [Streptomyces sp. CLI2509]
MGAGGWVRGGVGRGRNVAFVLARRFVEGACWLMGDTVVRCAEGHVFATSSFPMRRLGAARIGPGRLVRCPRCARLRYAVPVEAGAR